MKIAQDSISKAKLGKNIYFIHLSIWYRLHIKIGMIQIKIWIYKELLDTKKRKKKQKQKQKSLQREQEIGKGKEYDDPLTEDWKCPVNPGNIHDILVL